VEQKRFNVERIVAVLKQAEAGVPPAELIRAKVRLEMKDDNSAARLVICPDPENKLAFDYQYIVMPLRE
jgi:hypothetical protein